MYAVNFLSKYRSNLHFCNVYLSSTLIENKGIKLSPSEKHNYYLSIREIVFDYVLMIHNRPTRFLATIRLLIQVMVCFWVEQSLKYLHYLLNNIQFVVPEYGEASFTFNVQGDGVIARMVRAVLGGFSLQSKYCKIADSSVCETPFMPEKWQTWAMLFLLAIFYCLIGIYKSKSNYFMCRICDFLIPSQGEKRAEIVLGDLMEDRMRRSVLINGLAKEEFEDPVFLREQNRLILRFFQPRRWYHRFIPNIGLSTIANIAFGVNSIMCQVCCQDLITARFQCNQILFCEECEVLLEGCPCGDSSCQDGEIINV